MIPTFPGLLVTVHYARSLSVTGECLGLDADKKVQVLSYNERVDRTTLFVIPQDHIRSMEWGVTVPAPVETAAPPRRRKARKGAAA